MFTGRIRRGPWMQKLVLAVLLFFSWGICTFGNTNTPGNQKVFVGYLFRQPSKINFNLYTHICHAFVTADENGNIHTNRNVPSRELTSEAHQSGVKVILSVGGWGWDKQFAAIVSKPDSENRYVNAVLDLVVTYDYDG